MKYNAFPILLAGTFLSTSAVAQTVPTIDAKYLNQYTSPDITWEEVATSGDDVIEIKTGGTTKYFKYKYTTPEGREVYDEYGISRSGDVEYEDIHADFIGVATGIKNFVSEDYAYNISGNFINNGYSGYEDLGAIYNDYHGMVIKNIDGNFVGNKTAITNKSYPSYSVISSIDSIEGIFIGNERAISNQGEKALIKKISGIFIANNQAIDDLNSEATGGAIENTKYKGQSVATFGTINTIKGDFISNSAVHSRGNAFGGAIYNRGTIGEIINSNFIDNYVLGASAYGGAIYSTSSLNIIADNGTSLFSRNKANNESNAIYLQGQPPINTTLLSTNAVTSNGYIDLNLSVKNKGTITFDDVIDGEYYNININGDIDKEDFINRVTFNNKVNSVYDLTLTATQMALGKNAVIKIVHNYVAKNNPYLRLDLDAVNREVGQINIDGDVDGTTNVIVNILQNKETAKENSIVFATAQNDTLGGDDSFKIYRVIGSPFMWKVSYNDTAKEWGLYSTDEENTYKPEEDNDNQNEDDPVVPTPDTPGEDDTDTPDNDNIKVSTPEVIAGAGLHAAGIEQTRTVVRNVSNKVANARSYCPNCGIISDAWDGKQLHNAWVLAQGENANIDKPVDMEAKIWGIEGGFDLQSDMNNTFGVFASYRNGEYDLSGKGARYRSNIGSEIEIDSYLAGLYYRYDHNNWYAFATVYGGMQSAEIKTDDGISADTDGIEFGGSIEGGYNYALTRPLSVTPSLGVFYSQINYDDTTDSAGKTVEYNDLKQVELEAGAKFAHTQYTDDGFYSLYVKPSVVQTLVDGDEIDVTELGKVDTVEDKTLGRVEIGGNYGFNDNWSAYGWANYTFGSDYEATSLGAGLGYSW